MTSRTRRGAPRVLLAAFVAVAAVTATTAPAVADDAPGASPTTSTTLGVMSSDQLAQAVQLALESARLSTQLADTTRQVADVQSRRDAAQAAFEQLDLRFTSDQAALSDAVTQLRGRAVLTYERSSSLVNATLEIQHVQNLAVGQHYVESATSADTSDVVHISDDLSRIQAEHDRRAQQLRDLQTQLTVLNTQDDKLATQAASDQSALDQLGGVPVLGAAQLSAQQLASWFKSTGQHARLAGATTIDELAQLYVDEGAAAGVRADLAFAQAIIETGSFGHATDNNYAGIGACDSCSGEPAFPTPRDGVRAQLQLLRSYADPNSTATNLGTPPDPTLFGADPLSAGASFNSFYLKGKVPLWNQMGHGNWATDPNYAGKVLRTYSAMLTYAARTAGQ
jgi:hypothetical protein